MMERGPLWPSLILICLLFLRQDGSAESAFTIDWVKLSLPRTTVERGTNLTLHCEAKVSRSSPQLVQTFKFLFFNKVIYSVNTSSDVAVHSLGPARASNSGTYKCQVQIEKRTKDSNTLKLTVTGLQTPQLIVQPTVVNEGDEIMATCSAPEETGSLYFVFYKENQELQSYNSNSNSATITVRAEEIGNIELHCNYLFMMHTNVAQSKNSTRVKVFVKEIEITPLINILPTNKVVEGDRVQISCSVSVYGHRDLDIFLTKTSLLHKDHTSFTHSFEATAKDSGDYVCKAEKGNVQKFSKAHLKVAELFSRPLLKLSPEQAFEGQYLSLSCLSVNISQKRINATDVKYSLYKDQHLLKRSNANSFLASKAKNGNYTCVAEAKGINKTSNQLIVKFKVPVSVPFIRSVGQLIVGKPFQLLCESKQGTLPITYTLLKANRPVAHMTITEPLQSAIFNISSITYRNESSSFSCQAQNQGPQYSQSSQVLDTQVIETVSRPELTVDLKDNMTTEGSNLALYCSVQRGTVPITFTWYRKESLVPLHTTSVSTSRELHTIKDVTRDHKGTYYCEASNDANETRKSLPVDIEVDLAGWKKFAIGISCILLSVLIVFILLVLLKKAQAPRKQKRGVEMSVKSTRCKSDDPMRISLTLDVEDNTVVNATPCIMGRNVWSENVSNSDYDNESMEGESEKVQNNDVPTPQNMDSIGNQLVHSHQDELPASSVQDTDHVKGDNYTEGSTDPENISKLPDDLEYVQLNHSEVETA